jgi:hypothetical protein
VRRSLAPGQIARQRTEATADLKDGAIAQRCITGKLFHELEQMVGTLRDPFGVGLDRRDHGRLVG